MSAVRTMPRRAARHALARYRFLRARSRLARVARGSGPLIAGPWHSEVGFELLYWVPMLRWVEQRYGIDPDRVTVLSRGGAEPWYADLAGGYVDLVDELSVEGVRELRTRQAVEFGCQKQLRPLAEDRELVADVAARLGLEQARILHPAEMFWLFRGYWAGLLPLSSVSRHALYRPLMTDDVEAVAERLPDRYIAFKLYYSSCLPDRPETRTMLGELVEALRLSAPVVLLESDLGIDEHRFFDAGQAGDARPALSARDNLAVQSRIVRGAEALVTTYGGFSYLGPHLGTPTVSVYTDDNFNHEHLDVMRHASEALAGAGSSAAFEVTTVESAVRKLTAGAPVGGVAA